MLLNGVIERRVFRHFSVNQHFQVGGVCVWHVDETLQLEGVAKNVSINPGCLARHTVLQSKSHCMNSMTLIKQDKGWFH